MAQHGTFVTTAHRYFLYDTEKNLLQQPEFFILRRNLYNLQRKIYNSRRKTYILRRELKIRTCKIGNLLVRKKDLSAILFVYCLLLTLTYILFRYKVYIYQYHYSCHISAYLYLCQDK